LEFGPLRVHLRELFACWFADGHDANSPVPLGSHTDCTVADFLPDELLDLA
jgi:hypothetical protein